MSDWPFWKTFLWGWIAGVITLLTGVETIKSLFFSKKAKPELLESQNCFIFPAQGLGGKLSFDLLVNNNGSRDCSLMSVELIWPDGVITDFVYEPDLPATISTGPTVRIKVVSGNLHKADKFGPLLTGDSVEATVVAKFNNGKPIKKNITFIIKCPG